jgi:hypothetical protein
VVEFQVVVEGSEVLDHCFLDGQVDQRLVQLHGAGLRAKRVGEDRESVLGHTTASRELRPGERYRRLLRRKPMRTLEHPLGVIETREPAEDVLVGGRQRRMDDRSRQSSDEGGWNLASRYEPFPHPAFGERARFLPAPGKARNVERFLQCLRASWVELERAPKAAP